jgi:hypothetical protein
MKPHAASYGRSLRRYSKMIENNMVNERLHLDKQVDVVVMDKPSCDCGALADVKIKGRLRCWDCAKDEGVEPV